MRALWLGCRPYCETWQAMRAFTDVRVHDTEDEVWLLEHEPVYTLGLGGKPEHILDAGSIPVVRSDRGGQVTYHAPGQLVAYLLLDLRRLRIGVKDLVRHAEQTVITTLADMGLGATRREGVPGVFLGNSKIAALGFRIRSGCCYHGVAVNVDLDLHPYQRINPCGYPGLAVTSLREQGVSVSVQDFGRQWLPALQAGLGLVAEGSPIGSESSWRARGGVKK